MAIPMFDKLKSVTAEGKVLDYDEIADIPIIRKDLINETPSAYGYYQHTGETNNEFIKGIIYYYNGEFKEVGSGKNPLIMLSGSLVSTGSSIPAAGRWYYLNASFNREFEEGESCFGIVTAEGNTYAIVGVLSRSSDNSLIITVRTVSEVTGPQGEQGPAGADGTDGADGKDGKGVLILTSGTQSGATIAPGYKFTIYDPTFNREFEDGEACFAILSKTDGHTYATIGIVTKHSDDANVSFAPTVSTDITGKTPQRGVDYWTEDDQMAVVRDVITLLPKYNGEVV